ncbi:hypothetical protein [Bradyrhizobium sp. UFLA05-112]
MPTVIRRKRTSRLSLGPYRRHELRTGQIVGVVSGYTGYASGTSMDLADYISDEMRRDWQANRAALNEFWASGLSDAEAFPDDCLPWLCPYRRPGSLPWACEHLEQSVLTQSSVTGINPLGRV